MKFNPVGIATFAAFTLAAVIVSPWFLLGLAAIVLVSAVTR